MRCAVVELVACVRSRGEAGVDSDMVVLRTCRAAALAGLCAYRQGTSPDCWCLWRDTLWADKPAWRAHQSGPSKTVLV